MKNISLSLAIALMCISAFAQEVTSIAIIPSPASEGANLQAVVTTTFPGGPCSYVSQYPMVISNDTIIFDAIYCYESGSGGCTRVDTFDIGTLAAGDYTVRFKLTSTNTAGPCGSLIYQLKAIGLHNFGVVLGSGITQINTVSVQLSPNPITDRVYFAFDNNRSENVEITLLDISGKVMKTTTFAQGEQLMLNVAELPANVYFYTLKTPTQSSSGKLVKQ